MSKQISVSVGELHDRGKDFISGSQQLEAIIKKLTKNVDSLPSVWKGEAQVKFDAKYRELTKVMNEFIELVRSTGVQLQDVSKAMSNLDDEIAKKVGKGA